MSDLDDDIDAYAAECAARASRQRTGRPPQPVPAVESRSLLAWLRRGRVMASWCRKHGISSATVELWRKKSPEFAARYARAREDGHDLIAERMRRVARSGSESDVQHRRLQLDTDKWLLARWNGRYNERTQVDLQADMNVTVVTGVPDPEGDQTKES